MPDPQDRVIRVFVSSTFRDMQEEREELVKRVFPQLRKLCAERAVDFVDVDLRWGVTDEEAAEGRVLPICLAEIHRCRPFFLGLLGERYGWVPREIPAELIEQEPWLAEHREKSVTELEILHGVLNHAEMANRACFYFRDPAYLERLPAGDRRDFSEQDADRRAKLQGLKARIRQSGLALREGYPDPTTLGQWVLEDLTVAVNQIFPPDRVPDALDRDAAEHEAFARSRTGVYIGRQEYFDRLNAHAAGDGPPLVVLGESGSGKSALLANWATRYRQQHPDTLLLVHFIGATPYSADWVAMLRRILGEFKRHLGIEGEIPDKPDALRATFANWLHMASARCQLPSPAPGRGAGGEGGTRPARIILILDALNQLEDRDGAPDLVWLPPLIPENVRLILSTLPGRPLHDLTRRAWPVLRVEPLQTEERKELIRRYLAQYTKKLRADRIERIAQAEQAANPLYLRALLDELRVFGVHEQLDERIDHYLAARTVPDLYGRILQRWEEDHERDRPGLVRDAMTALWAARRGLSESELLELVGTAGQALARAHWSPLYLAAEQSLIVRSGLIGFFHNYLREAVSQRYLPGEESQHAAHLRLADYFEARDLGPRRMDEFPWQLAEALAWQRLHDLLADRVFLQDAWHSNRFDVKTYWARVESASLLRMFDAYRPILDEPAAHETRLCDVVSRLFADTGHPSEALLLRRHLVEHHRNAGDLRHFAMSLNMEANILADYGDAEQALQFYEQVEHIYRDLNDDLGIQGSLGNQALIRRDRGELDEAMQLYKRQEQICRELQDKYALQMCLGNQALAIRARGKLEEAMDLLKQQEHMCRELGDLEGIANALGNQAEILQERHELNGAMELNTQAERVYRDLGDQLRLQWVLGNKALILSERGDLNEAMQLFKQQEHTCRQLGNAEFLALSLAMQGELLARMGESSDAIVRAEQGYRLAVERGLRSLADRIKPILAHIRKQGANIAAILLDMPMFYYCNEELTRDWPSLAISTVPSSNETYLQRRLKEIPKTCVVVLVTAEQNARIIKDLLSENRYFGFSDSSFYYCSPPRCYLFEPHSGDFVIGSTGKKLLVSEGSLSALRSVFESGVAEAVLDRGIRYGYVSFLENCGATFDQAIIAMLYLSGKPLLAEVTTWEEDEGPLAVRHRGKNTLLEREQIDDKVYQHLKRNPKLVGGIGTNTYWLNIPEFLAALGLARDDLSEFRVAGQMDRAFQRIGQPLFGTHRCDGRDVIYPDGRLSALTQFIETLYVDVPRTRYVTARRECG